MESTKPYREQNEQVEQISDQETLRQFDELLVASQTNLGLLKVGIESEENLENDRQKRFYTLIFKRPDLGDSLYAIERILSVMAAAEEVKKTEVIEEFQHYINSLARKRKLKSIPVTGSLDEGDFSLVEQIRTHDYQKEPLVDTSEQKMLNRSLSEDEKRRFARLIFFAPNRKQKNETQETYILRKLTTRLIELKQHDDEINQLEVYRQFQEMVNCYTDHMIDVANPEDADVMYLQEDGDVGKDERLRIRQLQKYTHQIRRKGDAPRGSVEISDSEAFWQIYMSDTCDINPRIPLDVSSRTRGNSERYMKTAKEQIKKFFLPSELLELHERVQKLPPAERVVEVALAFESKRSGGEHMRFDDCNNFVTACRVFAGLGDEMNRQTTKSMLPHTADNWQSLGELEFDYTGVEGKNAVHKLKQSRKALSKEVLPKRGDRVYIYQSNTREEHSGIALGPIEIKQGPGGLEAWLRIISQPTKGVGPIIEPRRIARRGGYGLRFKNGAYGEESWLENKEYVNGRYDRTKENPNQPKWRSRNRYGHTIKKIDRPVDVLEFYPVTYE